MTSFRPEALPPVTPIYEAPTLAGTYADALGTIESADDTESGWVRYASRNEVDFTTAGTAIGERSYLEEPDESPDTLGHRQAVAEIVGHPDAIALLQSICETGEYALPDVSVLPALLRLAGANLIFIADGRAFATLEADDFLDSLRAHLDETR